MPRSLADLMWDEDDQDSAGDATYLETLRRSLVDTTGLDNITPPKPLIQKVLQMDSIAWLQGRPGSFKSFMALDLAGCIGTGQTWQGFPVNRGDALYLAAEGVSGIRQRVRAWETAMKEAMKSVSFLPIAVQAGSQGNWTALVDLAAELHPSLVVLDTQARVTVGMEENSARDMGIFVQRLEELRRATGACILVVHHEGRTGEHMRGSTALEGAATTVIRVQKDADLLKVECVKQKDQEAFLEFTLRLTQVSDSAVLSLTDLVRQTSVLSGNDLKLVQAWEQSFETDLVTGTKLVDLNAIPKSSVYASINKLVRLGIAQKTGTEKAWRYRLTGAHRV